MHSSTMSHIQMSEMPGFSAGFCGQRNGCHFWLVHPARCPTDEDMFIKWFNLSITLKNEHPHMDLGRLWGILKNCLIWANNIHNLGQDFMAGIILPKLWELTMIVSPEYDLWSDQQLDFVYNLWKGLRFLLFFHHNDLNRKKAVEVGDSAHERFLRSHFINFHQAGWQGVQIEQWRWTIFYKFYFVSCGTG